MKFTKMQALGNDFIITKEHFIKDVKNLPNLAKALCNRHFGIGADGLILICPSSKADIMMRIINADGSDGVMCGNGLRCLAKYVYEKKIVDKKIFKIQTTDGILHQALYMEEQGEKIIEIEIGKPKLLPAQVPVKINKGEAVLNEPLNIEGKTIYISCLSLGNPHCVIFEENLEEIPVEEIGPIIENHSIFPERANVEFVKIIDKKNVKMIAWERGAGRTLACGSGACAALVAGVLNNLCDSAITVKLEGGDLKVRWKDDGSVYLRGPCEEVFEGQLEVEKFINV